MLPHGNSFFKNCAGTAYSPVNRRIVLAATPAIAAATTHEVRNTFVVVADFGTMLDRYPAIAGQIHAASNADAANAATPLVVSGVHRVRGFES
jgi:hypothetical protein